MKNRCESKKQQLSERMLGYYNSNKDYHVDIHEVNSQRPSIEETNLFEKIKESQKEHSKASKILEIGCGTCEVSSALISTLNADVYHGVDASPFAIEAASQKYPNYHLMVGDAAHLNFDDNYFDIVVFNFVLEHMVYPDRVLSEAIRVTRPGGIIGLIVPVYDLPWLLPASLRYQRRNFLFLIRYTLGRWLEMLRLRYQHDYYSFRSVEQPIVLVEQQDYCFQPDDDLVYIASSLEIIKYLLNADCNILYKTGRDITHCIQNGQRLIIDGLRQVVFACLRISLLQFNPTDYTTTVSLLA